MSCKKPVLMSIKKDDADLNVEPENLSDINKKVMQYTDN